MKPVSDMTPAERRDLLRRRSSSAAGPAMEIGGSPAGRRAFRLLGRALVAAGVVAVFVVAFFRFTASWQVAMIVVGLMMAYMLLIGRMVEGRADRIE